MCRLFAFLGSGPERLEGFLAAPGRSLRALASEHGDGWGIARFDSGRAVALRRTRSADGDVEFLKATSGDRAETLVAHIRQATVGARSEANTHPFTFGPWAFAHNGTIPGAAPARERLLAELPPTLRANVKGTTDSELVFHRVLGAIQERWDSTDVDLFDAEHAVAKVFRKFHAEHEGDPEDLGMNFLLARREGFVATRFNRTLWACLGEGEFGPYTVLASVPLGSPEVEWVEIPQGHLVAAAEPGRIAITRIA